MRGIEMLFFVLAFICVLMALQVDNTEEYNAHVCAVYGYEPDCETPLVQE